LFILKFFRGASKFIGINVLHPNITIHMFLYHNY
jgi:hypothetical protein